jgi:PTH1 family peptidyl-tRNA hydrolase
MGTGRPRHNEPVEEFVLSPCYEDQQETMERAILLAVEACAVFVLEGVEMAMNRINSRNLTKPSKEEDI